MKFIKNWIKKIVNEVLEETNNVEKQLAHFTLSPDHPNVISIPTGNMPSAKAKDHIEKMLKSLKQSYPGYKFILISK